MTSVPEKPEGCPSKIHPRDLRRELRIGERNHEEHEERSRFPPGELHIEQKRGTDGRLCDGQNQFGLLLLVKGDGCDRANADGIDYGQHGCKEGPLIDVARDHVHQRDRRAFDGPRPIESGCHLGKFGDEWRYPLNEDEGRNAHRGRDRKKTADEWLAGKKDQRSANGKQS